jgi:hypothetical protein
VNPDELRQAKLEVSGRLRSMLRESGDPSSMRHFDVDAWVEEWLRLPMVELKGKSPEQMLRRANGLAVVVHLLERMRGGLCA